MRRRQFIALLGGAAAWPLAVSAQQRAMPVVGYLSSRSLETERELVAIFLKGLAETGHVEGRNVANVYRWADYRTDRLAGLATDLVRQKVAVIVASSTAPA